MPRLMWVGFGSAILLALICALVYALNERNGVAEATPSEVDTIVGVDADPTGNTGTSLGSINSCVSVNSTDVFYIDLFVSDVTNLNSWEGIFRFDESVVEVNALAVNGFFLGSSLWGPIFDCYEDPIGDEGQCTVGTFDTTGAGHTGSGVLGRLQLTAIGTDTTSKANFDLRADGLPVSGVILLDDGNPPAAIGDLDEDQYFDGDILNAEIAVDQPCPGECLPDVDTDGDGFDDDVECYLSTDQNDACPNNPSHDAWPLDIDMSTVINLGGDVGNYVGRIGSVQGDGNFLTRLDLNADLIINLGGDLGQYVGHIGEACS